MRGFGDLEAAIMDAVWDASGPVLVREVREKLNAQRPIAYTTVQTVMEILHRKGWALAAVKQAGVAVPGVAVSAPPARIDRGAAGSR